MIDTDPPRQHLWREGNSLGRLCGTLCGVDVDLLNITTISMATCRTCLIESLRLSTQDVANCLVRLAEVP